MVVYDRACRYVQCVCVCVYMFQWGPGVICNNNGNKCKCKVQVRFSVFIPSSVLKEMAQPPAD